MQRRHLPVFRLACLLVAATNAACVTNVNGVATAGRVGLSGNRINSGGDDLGTSKSQPASSAPTSPPGTPAPTPVPSGPVATSAPPSPNPTMTVAPTPVPILASPGTSAPSSPPSGQPPCGGGFVSFGGKFPTPPETMAIGPKGDIYAADATQIYRMDPSGAITALAGGRFPGEADGTGEAARFTGIAEIYYHAKTNLLYIRDRTSLRTMTTAGEVTTPKTASGGTLMPGRMPCMVDIGEIVEPIGNMLVRHVPQLGAPAAATYSLWQAPPGSAGGREGYTTIVVAGSSEAGDHDGDALSARFFNIADVVSDDVDFYVADMQNHKIKKVSAAGVVTTLAGDGTPGYADGPTGASKLSSPADLALGPNGAIYVYDSGNEMIRVLARNGQLSTLGMVRNRAFPFRGQIYVDAAGDVLVPGGDGIQKFTPASSPCSAPATAAPAITK